MARKSIIYRVASGGRDQGKSFVITELPARQADLWGIKVLAALANSGVPVPEEIVGSGLAGVAALGIPQVLRFNFPEFEPLIAELLSCVTRKDPEDPQISWPLSDNDIEEIPTLYELRREVLILHMGFLPPATLSKLTSMLRSAGFKTTPTSQEPSA